MDLKEKFTKFVLCVSPLCLTTVFHHCTVALHREHGVREEVRTPVQLAGQREATESSPVLHQLPQQMEPASLLSTTVHSYTTFCTSKLPKPSLSHF